jgi:hypothetical protein
MTKLNRWLDELRDELHTAMGDEWYCYATGEAVDIKETCLSIVTKLRKKYNEHWPLADVFEVMRTGIENNGLNEMHYHTYAIFCILNQLHEN